MATPVEELLVGPSGPASWPTAAVNASGVSLGGVLRYTQESVNKSGTALPASCSLYDLLAGANGVPTFPAAAAPANAVSIAEVLREIYDLGERVASSVGVDLTGGDVDDVFTIAGGPILLCGLWVDITTAVSANAALIHFESDPTVGASSTQISEGTAAPDIQSAALGDVFHINGDSQDVMKKAANGTDLPMMENQNGGIYVPVGGIDLKLTTSDPTTGAATIWMRYKPLARGVTVT